MTDTDSPRVLVLDMRLDPAKPTWVSIFGRKGSGKSVLGRAYWDSWPYDGLAIDPTGDWDLEGAEPITDPLPGRLMPGDDQRHRKWVYRPDPGSPTYKDDLDRAVGLAFHHPKGEPFLLHIDEIAEVTGASDTGPNMRRTLHQHRHRALTVICCGPRTKDINPLVLSQADYAMFFELPHELDQDRAAQLCQISRTRFAEAMAELPPFH